MLYVLSCRRFYAHPAHVHVVKMRRPFTAPELSHSIASLKRSARESRDAERRKNEAQPQAMTQLRLEHNSILREWSYRGTTFVPGSRRNGPNKAHLMRISRSSRESGDLPPLFQRMPDMRRSQRQWQVSKDYKKEIKILMESLNPTGDALVAREGAIEVMKLLGNKLRGRDEPTTATEPEPAPAAETVDAEEIVLETDTGVVFCEEMVRQSNGTENFEDTFRRMDIGNNGEVSEFELSTYLRAVGLRLQPYEVKAIHQYLRTDEETKNRVLTPANFAKRTRLLMTTYEKSRKALFVHAHSKGDLVLRAETYFKRQFIREHKPPSTAPI